jgi:GNAT superfamily N-acetyltransferase
MVKSAVVSAEGTMLDRVLDTACRTSVGVLSRRAYGTFHAARMKTPWGSRHQQRFALVEGDEILAGAERYDLSGVFDGRAVRVCAIGSVFTEPSQRGRGYARRLVEALLDEAEGEEAEVALLFPPVDFDEDVRRGFRPMSLTDVSLAVTESSRHGAPMTTVRGGEERDLAAIVAMGRVRAEPFRFHLDRDVDFVQYAITTRRLLAGLGSAQARKLQFFIAEEGITAAAYVVISVVGDVWTVEECGDRDSSGARVGALLQALIAREPGERRPTIRAWLPPGFLPPQVAIASAAPSTDTVWVRALGSRTIVPPLSSDDILFWRNDIL